MSSFKWKVNTDSTIDILIVRINMLIDKKLYEEKKHNDSLQSHNEIRKNSIMKRRGIWKKRNANANLCYLISKRPNYCSRLCVERNNIHMKTNFQRISQKSFCRYTLVANWRSSCSELIINTKDKLNLDKFFEIQRSNISE